MWTKTISQFSKNCKFSEPASRLNIDNCELELGITLHDSLRDLLLETDGVYETELHLRLIWSVDEIKKQNKFYRTDSEQRGIYMPFDNLLFFADSGFGDLFAMPYMGTMIPLCLESWGRQ
jgi:cell wall assembly regulator SMI1